MEVKLIRAGLNDAERLWKMQTESFAETYKRYHDRETNPAAEPQEKTAARLSQPYTYYYFILADGAVAGAVRIIDTKEKNKPKRISPIFIMPPYRNKGIAQKAIIEAERIHGKFGWELYAILQEAGSCHLYEKMGYRKTEEQKTVSDEMTLVLYKKDRTEQ